MTTMVTTTAETAVTQEAAKTGKLKLPAEKLLFPVSTPRRMMPSPVQALIDLLQALLQD